MSCAYSIHSTVLQTILVSRNMLLRLLIVFLTSFVAQSYELPISANWPIGTVTMFAGDVIPSEWILCDGRSISRTTYSSLFNVIGTLYGVGDHVRTFNLPDFRGRFPLGLDGQLGQRAGIAPSGASTVTVTQAELPPHLHGKGTLSTRAEGAHSHSIFDPGHNHGGSTGSGPFTGGSWSMNSKGGAGNERGDHRHTIFTDYTRISINPASVHTHMLDGNTAVQGEGKPFSIMPPSQRINYIIYAGPQFSDSLG